MFELQLRANHLLYYFGGDCSIFWNDENFSRMFKCTPLLHLFIFSSFPNLKEFLVFIPYESIWLSIYVVDSCVSLLFAK